MLVVGLMEGALIVAAVKAVILISDAFKLVAFELNCLNVDCTARTAKARF